MKDALYKNHHLHPTYFGLDSIAITNSLVRAEWTAPKTAYYEGGRDIEGVQVINR